MATRSVIVKLRPSTACMKRSGPAAGWQDPNPALFGASVWATHAFVNDAAGAYSDLLLQMRQGDVCIGIDDEGADRIVAATKFVAEMGERLITRATGDQQTLETVRKAATTLADLRTLYSAIVPSFQRANQGTAQEANAYLSKLVDPQSEAGEASAAKEELLRTLIPFLAVPHDFADRARELFENERAQAVLVRGPGVPSAWAALYRKEGASAAWLEALAVPVGKLATIQYLKPLAAFLERPSVFEEHARALFLTDYAHSVLLNGPGTASKWAKLYKKDAASSTWLEALTVAVRDISEDPSSFTRPAIGRLGQLGVFPLMEPYGKGRIEVRARGALTKFERMAFSLLVAGLNPWESKRATMQASRDEMDARLRAWDDRFGASHADARGALQSFEADELLRLRMESLADERTIYRAMPRELRGWRDLREYLTSETGRSASAEQRMAWLSSLQTKLGRAFGGQRLLAFLATPAQQWLADHSAGDVVSRIARRNELQRQRERARVLPIWTVPDSVHHPRFSCFDTPANTNNPPFTILSDDGKLFVEIDLLTPRGGPLTQQTWRVEVAASGQLGRPLARAEGNQIHLEYDAQDRTDRIHAILGGSTLQLSRRYMESRSIATLASGRCGPVWMKLALKVGEENEAILKENRRLQTWLQSSLGKRLATDGVGRPPLPGDRVMAVDLGLRSAATVSTWRVSAAPPTTALPGRERWSVALGSAALDLYAFHESTSPLTLPGEKIRPARTEGARGADDPRVEPSDIAARRAYEDACVRTLLGNVSFLGAVRRWMHATTPSSALAELTEACTNTVNADAPADTRVVRATATELAHLSLATSVDAWKVATANLWRRLERDDGAAIAAWRRRLRAERAQARSLGGRATARHSALGGKSAWYIEHLERRRKLLLRWHLRQRPEDTQVRRLGFRHHGTHARRLLEHVTKLKEDRSRTTADLIVQAARGYVWDEARGWHRRHQDAACRVIVLEDLSRYRFKSDRPRAENRQLMQWSHRRVTELVIMQAEIYGIAVATVGAAFSSRYDARTGSPGVRCTTLTKEMARRLAHEPTYWLRAWADRIFPVHGWHVKDLCTASGGASGTHLPTGSGEVFASRDGTRCRVKHADVNAAQNLAIRALTAQANPVRMVVRRVQTGSDDLWVAKVGKMLAGGLHALGGGNPGEEYALLRAGRAGGFVATLMSVRGLNAALKSFHTRAPELAEADEGDPEDTVLADTDTETVTFFRDPSLRIADGEWLPSKAFWGRVHAEVWQALKP